MLNYRFAFCPRYRRKIFLIDGLENRFKGTVCQICKQNDMKGGSVYGKKITK